MKRTPLKPISAKRRKLSAARKRCCEIVAERSGGRCEVHDLYRSGRDVVWDRCDSPAAHVHEIRRRSQGGDITDPKNCLHVCAVCHDKIHRHPLWAKIHGYLSMRKEQQ